MQLNRGLPVRQIPNWRTSSIKFSVSWKGRKKRLRGQTINKTVTNQNHTEPKRTKPVIWNCSISWPQSRTKSVNIPQSVPLTPTPYVLLSFRTKTGLTTNPGHKLVDQKMAKVETKLAIVFPVLGTQDLLMIPGSRFLIFPPLFPALIIFVPCLLLGVYGASMTSVGRITSRLTLKWPRYFYSRWCPRGVPRDPTVENHFPTGILQWNLHHICGL